MTFKELSPNTKLASARMRIIQPNDDTKVVHSTGPQHYPGDEVVRRFVETRVLKRHDQLRSGYDWLHAQQVTQADEGCDFDFAAAEWGGGKPVRR